MTFKKDYINYVLHTAINSKAEGFINNSRLNNLVNKIMSVDDVVKITYLVGKTAGLEFLFKYLLYISDKIDKSQITIFNLKDNFDYDVKNLIKICHVIQNYQSSASSNKIESIPAEKPSDEQWDEANKQSMKVDVAEEPANLINIEDVESLAEETAEESRESNLTLIENPDSYTGEAEVFELSEIDNTEQTEEAEVTDKKLEDKPTDEDTEESEEVFELDEIESEMNESKVEESKEYEEPEVIDKSITAETDDIIEEKEPESAQEPEENLAEVEILINQPVTDDEFSVHGKHFSESVANEAYYKFETKFFEEVKILEKLFSTIENVCKTGKDGKLNEKCLQSLTEIIEITSELGNLSRQLSFDLIADIFLTMNLYFTKAISSPGILTGEIIRLLDSSLALVNSLIKGEDYLNYDAIVERIEKLKRDIARPAEEPADPEESVVSEAPPEIEITEQHADETEYSHSGNENEQQFETLHEPANDTMIDSANFKMKYLIKEFEKSFQSIDDLKGEYSKFDALEKVDELNNALRLIAKIAASVKNRDVLKLAEVSYVFLKYVKDYRMDLLDPEIHQIVKYIIFTFKMLLTDRKPEDFNVLVQHLNNPVKIFTDS